MTCHSSNCFSIIWGQGNASLRSRRLEVVGERENRRAWGRHARGVSPSRAPVFSCDHYFQAPATQARETHHRCPVFQAANTWPTLSAGPKGVRLRQRKLTVSVVVPLLIVNVNGEDNGFKQVFSSQLTLLNLNHYIVLITFRCSL